MVEGRKTNPESDCVSNPLCREVFEGLIQLEFWPNRRFFVQYNNAPELQHYLEGYITLYPTHQDCSGNAGYLDISREWHGLLRNTK